MNEIDDSNLAICCACGYVDDWVKIPGGQCSVSGEGLDYCPECGEVDNMADYTVERASTAPLLSAQGARMTDKQPEALRLADAIDQRKCTYGDIDAAADELRRLHEVNAELVEALRVTLVDLRIASDSGDFGTEFEPSLLQGQRAIDKAIRSSK